MVKEFYPNAIHDGDELKCWVRGKDFTITPSYLAIILNINRPVFLKPLVYHYLLNWGCSLQSCSTNSILSQAPSTWILVRLGFFMTWSLMKKLTFAHASSTFWARLLRERPQGTTFLFVASFRKFWSSKVFTHWKMSTLILCKAQSTLALSMLS